jgi:capsular exopolysaccharide synthesis family protein
MGLMTTNFEPAAPEGMPSQLPAYVAILRQRARAIVLVGGLVVAVALALSLAITPVYEARARVLVENPQLQNQSTRPDMETERQLLGSVAVAQLAAKNLKTTESASALLKRVSVEIVPQSNILLVRFRHTVAVQAQQGAERFADAYLAFRRNRVAQDLISAVQPLQDRIEALQIRLRTLNGEINSTPSAGRQSQLQAQGRVIEGQIAALQNRKDDLTSIQNLQVGEIIDPAHLPSSPASPNLMRNVALGVFLGLGLGIATAFVLERLDDRVRTGTQLEAHSSAPLLAVLPKEPRIRKGRPDILMTITYPDAPLSEAYRTLRAAVLFTAAKQRASTILITSPHGEDGKTTVTANLGVVIANTGKRVILVSADRRRPRLHRLFGTEDHSGLTQLVNGDHFPADLLVSPGIDNLRLLPSGQSQDASDDLFTSSAMRNLLRELRLHADIILIDAPPILPVADTLTLAPLVDAVLLVVQTGTPRAGVVRARQRLDLVNARVIGSVLNKLEIPRNSAYEYSQYTEFRRAAGHEILP